MNNQPSTARIALKWGLITGVALVLYSAILFTSGQTTNRLLSLMVYAILIAGLILAMREYRTANEGYMNYGDGISVGALLSAVAGLLSSMFSVFYTQVIDPNFYSELSEQMRTQLEDQGLSDEQIDQAIAIAQKVQSPGIAFFVGILSTVLLGVILSLIIAAFIRRSKPNPFE